MKTNSLSPLSASFGPGTSSAYWGERRDWLVACAMHRDSDCLARSNFACMLSLLGGESESVQIERASHWAVGWLDRIVIDPAAADKIALAESTLAKLDDYPVINDEHYSQVEQDEAETIWRDCYSVAERVKYIREHRSQFECRDFADLLGTVRGNYFAGYASELIS